jgi:hypothetical protein
VSVAEQVSDAVRAAVDGLSLSGFPDSVALKAPILPPGLEPPQAVVTVGPEGDAEYLWAGVVLMRYPVAVTLVTAGGYTLADDMTLRGYRERVRKVLDTEATYSGVTGFNTITVGGRAPFDMAALDKTLNYSTVVVTVEVIESRT